MECSHCKKIITYKDGVNDSNKQFITLKCACKCILIRSDGSIKVISSEEHKNFQKKNVT